MTSLVNASTGEVIAYCTPDEAKALTERIRETAEQVWSLLLEAHERKAWAALGYPTWAAYVQAEFDMTKRHANRLVVQGEVIRAIESEVGPVGPTVSERAAREVHPRLKEVTSAIRERITAESTPPEPDRLQEIVTDEITKLREAKRQRAEDRAALTELSQNMAKAGMDMDEGRLSERGKWSTNCREIPATPPAEFIERHAKYLTQRHVNQAERAHEWLDEFLRLMEDAR